MQLTARLSAATEGGESWTRSPFGLEGVCSTYHDALQNLGTGRATRQALLVAFEIEMVRGAR